MLNIFKYSICDNSAFSQTSTIHILIIAHVKSVFYPTNPVISLILQNSPRCKFSPILLANMGTEGNNRNASCGDGQLLAQKYFLTLNFFISRPYNNKWENTVVPSIAGFILYIDKFFWKKEDFLYIKKNMLYSLVPMMSKKHSFWRFMNMVKD